jgi:hypothetical protein
LLALIAIGAAAFLLINSEQRINQRANLLRAFDRDAREATDALVDARVGQQAYVAAGQGVAFWFDKTARSLQSASDALTRVHGGAGTFATTSLDQAAATIAEFSAIDKRARDYLNSGEQLMAGDVIFTEGGQAAATAVQQIETARQAQHQEAEAETAAIRKQQALTAGAVAGFVALLVLLLIPVPRPDTVDTPAESGLSLRTSPPVERVQEGAAPKPAPAPPKPTRLTAQVQGSLFKAATDVVTDLGRVRDVPELTRVLGRAAEVMDASGLIVWIGSAGGDDLRPALAHGYSEEAIARFPPVPRSADNAAAAAYRLGTFQIVNSRPGGARGAVVAPILSVDGCIGALSVEIRSGGETSQSVQALAAIFAAQLAGVFAAAPAAEVQERRAAANS